MNSLFILTQSANSILRPIARVLGMLMNGIYNLMDNLFNVQNIAIAIVLFTVIVYIIMLPMTIQQQKFSKMSQLMNPEIQEVQKKYRGKRDSVSMQLQNEETQAIYRKYGVRPSGSCVFMLIQLLILIPLYRVIYSVPGYVFRVKETFSDLVNVIMATDGYQNLVTAFYEIVSDGNSVMSQVSLNFEGTLEEAKDTIIDLLYRCTSDNWALLARIFDSDVVVRTQAAVEHFTNFLGASIVYSPMVLIRTSAAAGHYFLIFIAILIPIISAGTQFLSVFLMPQPNNGTGDQTGNSMRMMTYIMPFYSFFIVFFLPIGVGIYWIAGAVIRVIQQLFINRYYNRIDMNALLEKNKQKAEDRQKKKVERKGVSGAQIQSAASINTKAIPRSMADRAAAVSSMDTTQSKGSSAKGGSSKSSSAKGGSAKSSSAKSSSAKGSSAKGSSAKSGAAPNDAAQTEAAAGGKGGTAQSAGKSTKKYKEGSMAALANKVTEYNERNSSSKNSKKSK